MMRLLVEEESKAKNKEAGVPKRGGGCSTDASTGGREGEREGMWKEGENKGWETGR